MRLPHHLLRHPSGVYHFRLVVPKDLREVFGKKVHKISLRTRDTNVAMACAYALGARYAGAIATLRATAVPKPDLDALLRSLQNAETMEYKLKLAGGVSIEANGAEDHMRALETLKVVFAAPLPTAVPARSPASKSASDSSPTSSAVSAGRIQHIGLGEAARKYLLSLSTDLPSKTKTQKRSAVAGFAAWKGDAIPTAEATRTDVSEWFQTLRISGLTTATLANKQSYLTAFFAWAQSGGYYPEGSNPAEKHIKQTAREKRHRRKEGFRSFTADQVRALYAPEALRALNPQTRWGALLGLYTGARVSEVGQLRLSDVLDEDGVPCLRITADGFGQSLKNDASERVIPIHPDLLALGLLRHVKRLREQGEKQVFPRAKAGSVNGMGNWLSKSFGRHLDACGVVPEGKGMVGFHSLRKTAIEAMTLAGVRAEARAQFVGHELSDEHHAAYGYAFLKNELLHGVGKGPNQTAGIDAVSYDLDLDSLRSILSAGD